MAGHDLNTIPINDLDDPRLAPYRNQKDAWLRAAHNPDRAADHDPSAATGDAGLFMAEGALVVEQLIASPCPVHSVLINRDRLERVGRTLAGLDPAVPIYLADGGLMDSVVGFRIHRGVLAAGVRPPPIDPEDLIARARLLVVLEDLANHDNVGGIFRSVAALAGLAEPGSQDPPAAVLLTRRTCDPLYRKALRVSIGLVLRVPWAIVDPWPGPGLELLHRAGVRTLALTPAHDATPIDALAVEPGERLALIVGAEGPGLGDATLRGARQRVSIPIHHAVDSLNVTVAASIALAGLARRPAG